MERSEERKKIGSDPGGVSAESDVATAKAATAKEAALDEENEAVIKEKAEETARELSAAAAVDINFVADSTPLAENSAQNFEQNGNEPKIGKTEEEIAVKIKYSDVYYDEYIAHFEKNTKKRYGYKFIKRLFDFTISLIAILLLSPLFVIIAILIKIDSKGPVFFRQKRVGRNKKEFTCIKFRSMKIDAPHDEATSLFEHPEKYITKVGRILRKSSLDELPQLFCCLIGTMSIIGYRPLVLTEKHCNSMREKLGVFEFRPGISGYAQVHGRDDVYYKNKAILDAEYVKKASVILDVRLMFQTIKIVVTKKGNDSEKIDNVIQTTEKDREELQEIAVGEGDCKHD